MHNRQLNNDEVIALQTYNCCSQAILDNLSKLERRLKAYHLGWMIGLLKGAAKILHNVVLRILMTEEDPDLRQRIIIRMSKLQLQFGHTRKHPEPLVILTIKDAQTLLGPVLEKCDLECPCITYDDAGNKICDPTMVKGCEIRKALRRAGLAEVGISADCPYQMIGRNNS